MSDTENEEETHWPVYDLSEDPGDIYFCTPCKIDFRKIEDLNVHLKTKDHKRNKRYEQKIYNRRSFGGGDAHEGPLLMSEPETSEEEEDETMKFEREARLRNNLCMHKGYGFSCGKCIENRIDTEENENFDFAKIGKHLETVYHRMVKEYGDDLSIPSSCSEDLGENIFETADTLVESLAEYDGSDLDKKDEEEEEMKETDDADNDDIMEEMRSKFEEILQDPESGYENRLPRVVETAGDEDSDPFSESEKEDRFVPADNPFQMTGGGIQANYDMLRGKIRFSNKIKKIRL